ncbi:MAG TPA: hypothetical protein VG944_20060 [Fimbriimonas sp.]|nr:hypothetical protein [Fimbriimonas sp.]
MPALLALALVHSVQPSLGASGPTQFQSQVPQVGPYNYSAAPAIAEPVRLQITPKLDGRIDNDEWDPLTTAGDSKTYFQWAPGIIYAAASGPAGTDLVLSLDLQGDGWLVGDDNYEARISMAGGKPTLSVRQLDATNVAGPVWKDLAGWTIASTAMASSDGTHVTYELRLCDAYLGVLPRKPTKMNARVDLVPSGDPGTQAFIPRGLAPITLETRRAEALPSNLQYGVEHADRPAAPGDNALVRFTFKAKGKVGVKKIHILAEGQLKDQTNELSVPFPAMDSKGRAFVDYSTRIGTDADLGYHVLKGTLTLDDGTPAVIETSFRVAPPVDVVVDTTSVKADPHDRSLHISYHLTSNTTKAVGGEIGFALDPRFRVVNGGSTQKFRIFDTRSRAYMRFEVFVPGKTTGTYPIEFHLTANGEKSTVTRFITIG